MSEPPGQPVLEDYLDLLAKGDRRGALRLIRRLARDGADGPALLDLVGTAQREVGRRWQRAEWTVAQEHTATAVSDAVVSHLLDAMPVTSGRGRIAVVCADGEWHVLPARMFALALESSGWEVQFVGGSVPPEHLYEALPRMRVSAVAVSCTMSMRLPGAARTVAAAHSAGLPVLVGGPAFDPDGHRAAAIGADAQAASVEEATAILTRWLVEAPAALAQGIDATAASALAAGRHRIVTEGYAALVAAYPRMAEYDQRQLDRTREDLGHHVDYVIAALRTEDPRVYHEMVGWLDEVLAARGLPSAALGTSLRVLREVLGMLGHDHAARLVATAEAELAPTDDT